LRDLKFNFYFDEISRENLLKNLLFCASYATKKEEMCTFDVKEKILRIKEGENYKKRFNNNINKPLYDANKDIKNLIYLLRTRSMKDVALTRRNFFRAYDLNGYISNLYYLKETNEAIVNTIVRSGSAIIPFEWTERRKSDLQRMWSDYHEQRRQRDILDGLPDPYPNGIPSLPNIKPIIGYLISGDEHLIKGSWYSYFLRILNLPQSIMYGAVNSVLLGDVKPLDESIDPIKNKKFDIREQISNEKDKEKAKLHSYRIICLAKQLGINLCMEKFCYITPDGRPNSPDVLPKMGLVEDFLIELRWRFGYEPILKDNTLFLKKIYWACCRYEDIPESQITYWAKWLERRRIGEDVNGRTISLSVTERRQLIESFNDAQILATLPQYLPQLVNQIPSNKWSLRGLRFIYTVPPSLKEVLKTQGLPLHQLPSHQRRLLHTMLELPRAIRFIYGDTEIFPTEQEVEQAIIRIGATESGVSIRSEDGKKTYYPPPLL
jgi:hypothetical protein